MRYTIKAPKYYRKQFNGSKQLFAECWSRFTHDEPEVNCDKDVLNYLQSIALDITEDNQ